MIGDIMRISRLRMGTDGKGITTLVAFYDCPLHCKYCINNYCHDNGNTYESITRGSYTPRQLINVLKKDDIYYKLTGGGITFGGGEPLLQSAFIHEVCKLADPMWKMRIETSLNVPWRLVEPVTKDIDEWIIDIKETDRTKYKEYTGRSMDNVVDALYRLKKIVDKDKLHIRVPRIPGFNDGKDIYASTKWVRDTVGVSPEIFDYYIPAQSE